jgi:hypothetical protein
MTDLLREVSCTPFALIAFVLAMLDLVIGVAGLLGAAKRSRSVLLFYVLASLGLLSTCWLAWKIESPAEGVEGVLLTDLDDSFKHKWFPFGVIQTGPPDESYVCHDWALGQGAAEHVEGNIDDVLRKRGYRRVPRPWLGDVIIYRGPNGSIMHSGLVKAVGKNGFVLVESKWGALGRYLHEPKIEGLDASYAFYHRFVSLDLTQKTSSKPVTAWKCRPAFPWKCRHAEATAK